MGGRWPYSFWFVGCCFQGLFDIARSFLEQFPPSFFNIRLVSVHVVYPYSRIDTVGKNAFYSITCLTFIWSINQLIAVYTFISCILRRCFRGRLTCPLVSESHKFNMELPPFWSKHMYSVLTAFRWKPSHLLLAPDFAARTRFGLLYLQEALCHLRSLRP